MSAELVSKITVGAPALEVGQFAVVAQGFGTGEVWNTGRTYDTASAAFARQTREMSTADCAAWVVKRHRAGTTVYLAPDHVLGSSGVSAVTR